MCYEDVVQSDVLQRRCEDVSDFQTISTCHYGLAYRYHARRIWTKTRQTDKRAKKTRKI